MSQLAAQLARPSHGTLPTYSQAISQQVAGGVVTTLQSGSTHALQTSPLRRPSEAASPHTQLMTSPGPQHSLASPSEGGSGRVDRAFVSCLSMKVSDRCSFNASL